MERVNKKKPEGELNLLILIGCEHLILYKTEHRSVKIHTADPAF